MLAAWCVLPAARARAEEPVFVLHTAGDPSTGPLESLEADGSVRLGGAGGRTVAGAEVVSLRRADRPPPAYPAGEQVVFANGDRLAGEGRRLAGERLTFRVDREARSDWALPLSGVAVVWLATPEGADAEALLRQLISGRRKRDTVLLRNGDTIEGTLTGLDRDRSVFNLRVGRKEVTVEFDKVAAAALSTDLMQARRPKGPYARVALADGSRLALASCRVAAGTLEGKTLFGADVQVPVERVMAVDVYNGRAVYLSDLKPREYRFVPYLGTVRWACVADGSVAEGSPAGLDLRLAGGTFDKGLGMHSGGRVTYDLAGQYQRFEAWVGLDEHRLGRRGGRPVVGVWVDGKPQDLGEGKELRPGAVLPVRVNVTGARELTLAVEYGLNGEVGGRVDWADARLVKASADQGSGARPGGGERDR